MVVGDQPGQWHEQSSCADAEAERDSRSGAGLRRMHASGDYSIADLADLFTVSRPTVYRTFQRSPASPAR